MADTTEINDDVIRCILEHACNLKVQRNVRPIEARLAIGEQDGKPGEASGDSVTEIGARIMTAAGLIHARDTILMRDITRLKNNGVELIWGSEMVIVKDTGPDDLCIVDPHGDEYGAYDEERNEYDVESGVTCLSWGSHKRVSYSIRLSHAISVSVTFDVLVVPTSWWVDDCEGTFWVVQILNAHEATPAKLALDSYGYSRRDGFRVAGWAEASEEDEDDE